MKLYPLFSSSDNFVGINVYRNRIMDIAICETSLPHCNKTTHFIATMKMNIHAQRNANEKIKGKNSTVYLVDYLTEYKKMLGSSSSPKSMILLFKLFVLVKTCHCGYSFILFVQNDMLLLFFSGKVSKKRGYIGCAISLIFLNENLSNNMLPYSEPGKKVLLQKWGKETPIYLERHRTGYRKMMILFNKSFALV
jgi:hypothetical protein